MPRSTAIDALIDRTISGDAAAWQALVAHIHPRIIATCRNRWARAAPGSDLPQEVAAATLERLHARDFAALRRYAEQRQRYPQLADDESLQRWLAAVAHSAYVDWVRSQPEQLRRRDGAGGRRADAVTLTVLTGQEPAPSQQAELATGAELRRALAVINHARFPEPQRQALALWLQGYRAGELAEALQLPNADAARRLVHAARQRLRRALQPDSTTTADIDAGHATAANPGGLR